MHQPLDRRVFLQGALASAGGLCLAGPGALPAAANEPPRPPYRGPNVIIIRFGGGVRRRETIDPDHTCAPYFRRELLSRATLFPNLTVSESHTVGGQRIGLNTGHGEGTLNILTGRYADYKDVDGRPFANRFEAPVPTLFEYLRRTYRIPSHQALIVNGEDRTDEEFYSFSNHHLFGVRYRSSVLSLYRFKCHLLRRQIESGAWDGTPLARKRDELARLEAFDYRARPDGGQGPAIEAFWDEWRAHYGDTGLVNPRGDRLLTELAVRAIRRLRPRLMIVNYNDPDYVHWGNMAHYTRAIAVIDAGIRRLIETCEADERYRDNTVFVITPDCGRDSNRYMAVPCQHHFNSRSSREVFAMFLGPGIERGQIVDKPADQVAICPTIGRIMDIPTPHAEGQVLADAIS